MKPIILFTCAVCLGSPVIAQLSTEEAPAAPGAAGEAIQANWLLGSWSFDEEFTRSKQAKAGGDRNVVSGAGPVDAAQVMDKMKGARLTITASEIKTDLPDRESRAENYTVMPGGTAEEIKLKQANGVIHTFRREGDRISMVSAGSVTAPFYFKKDQ